MLILEFEKKAGPEMFDAVKSEKKPFDIRLCDFDCKPGDMIVLKEFDPKRKAYTGRELHKQISFVMKLNEAKFWSKQDVDKVGLQIMGFKTNALESLQERIARFAKVNNLKSDPEHSLLDLVSEVGELSKEILKMSSYGTKKIEFKPEAKAELGDVFYSLITVANVLDINLQEALEAALIKYNSRIARGGISSDFDA